MMQAVSNPRLDELAAVFRWLFARCKASEQDARVSDALSLVEDGELDPEGIFVVGERGSYAGVVVAVPLPGAGAVFWAPLVKRGGAAVEDQLMRAACRWLRGRGVKLAHALIQPGELRSNDGIFLRNGFAHVTAMQYLRLPLAQSQELRPALKVRSYDADVQAFEQTLLRTYRDSLDCPELTGVRTIEEVIAGHRAQGSFDSQRWWLANHEGKPAGVLLLADMPEWDSWDISYLGVTPEARRCGIARQLIQLAKRQAYAAGVSELTVAVDVRNQPAWNLYTSMDFQPGDRREVYLAIFG